MLKLRIGNPNTDSLTLNQYYINGGVGSFSYNKNFIENGIGQQFKLCNWIQTKMIIAEIVSFTEITDKFFNKKYYITFNNAIIINRCDINFESQCSRKYIE
jgi:hypothetical protein